MGKSRPTQETADELEPALGLDGGDTTDIGGLLDQPIALVVPEDEDGVVTAVNEGNPGAPTLMPDFNQRVEEIGARVEQRLDGLTNPPEEGETADKEAEGVVVCEGDDDNDEPPPALSLGESEIHESEVLTTEQRGVVDATPGGFGTMTTDWLNQGETLSTEELLAKAEERS